MLPHTDGEVLNDEVVIIHSSSSVGESKIFEPYTGVCLLGVLGDVGGRSEALWERRSLDATTKGPWPLAIRARALVIYLATMPRMCVPALLYGQVGARATCSRCHLMHVIIVSSMALIVDDTMSITVWPEPFTHRWSVWSGHRVGLWCNRGLLPMPGNYSGEWMERFN